MQARTSWKDAWGAESRIAAALGPYGPLPLRAGIFLVLIVHAGGRLTGMGPAAGTVSGFAAFLGSEGVPLPTIAAWTVTLVEILGGLAVLLGVWTRVAALLVAIDMTVATLLVHAENGFLAGRGGMELTLLMTLAALSLVASGAGPKLALQPTR